MKRTLFITLGLAAAVVLVGWGALKLIPNPPPDGVVVQVNPDDDHQASANGTIEIKRYEDGTIKERHTPYADGSVGHEYFRPDKTLRRTTEHYPPARPDAPATLKAEATWSEDGKTLVEGKAYRPNESLWFTRSFDKDGNQQDSYYFADGWKFKTVAAGKNKSVADITYLRRDGSLWAKERAKLYPYNRTETSSLEAYNLSGDKPVFRLEYLTPGETSGSFTAPQNPQNNNYYGGYGSYGQGALYTFFDDAGRARARQWYSNGYLYHGHGINKPLSFVETLNVFSGVVQKHYDVSDSGGEVRLTECALADGTARVYETFTSHKATHMLKEFDYYNTRRTRELVVPALDYVRNADGSETDATREDEIDEVDPELFKLPSIGEALEKEKLRAAGDDMSPLGNRNDRDPVKWYRRP